MLRILVSLIFVGLFLTPPAQAEIFFPFTGELDFPQKRLVMTIQPNSQSPIAIKIAQAPNKEYQMSTTINHWSLPFFDISTVLEGAVEMLKEKDGSQSLRGKVWSKYTLVNFKPVGEVKGNWHIKQDTLFIDNVTVGTLTLQGSVQLVAPFQIDLNIRISSIDLIDFVSVFTNKMDLAGKGDVQGEVRVFGYPGKIFLKGKLMAYDGYIEKLEFNRMFFNIEGVYPLMHVDDSNITQTDGLAFAVEGTLDLSDQENFKKQIQEFIQEPMVKENSQGREWTLKRLSSGEKSGTTELKYMFKKDATSEIDTRDSSDMLGVERKMEF